MAGTAWIRECRRLLLLCTLSLAFGFFAGLPGWSLALVVTCYALWQILQQRRVLRWLDEKENADPPEAGGLWGHVLDRLYFSQQQDRRQRQRLQSAVDHLRNSFDSLPYGAVMIDTHGTIEWFNPAAARLFGLRSPDDRHNQLVNLVRNPAFIGWFEAGNFSEPLELPSPVAPALRLEINISRFGDNNRLLMARDITRTHRLETIRRDFVANVSHELRTPLTVIAGYLQTLDGNPQLGGKRMQQAITQMLAQATRMDTLVNDLMTLSRLETVPEGGEQERVRIAPLLDQLREEALAAASGERDIQLECDPDLLVLGSYNELRSAASNLVMNAVRYTAAGDRIWLRWKEERGAGLLEIEDTGIGIENSHLPRLTERFYRVDASRSIHSGGTGLGLAIVKHVLMRHAARLEIRSHPGRGSCFSCHFPAERVVRSAAVAIA